MLGGDYECCSAPDERSRWQKLRSRMFPARRCKIPDAPSEFKDCIHGRSVAKLCFSDRLRVLLTGVIVSEMRIVTENEVGGTSTCAEIYVGTSQDVIR